ncbi:transporter substrate-binding domain-containing protein [Insolitispirillum peregrinum]|uniref:Signal transduction histidine kinase n=1 Tax=Insolitispirillum peregrinum TaxID=80876 RepID=A0A1N7Q4P6_9PROT|nr:transporter substrate-binding domain-containing protein [Insolitispirillum peregrinum]SIT17689.1 Signal transduction histidine kinase [Insolitispirillum peregrinum]
MGRKGGPAGWSRSTLYLIVLGCALALPHGAQAARLSYCVDPDWPPYEIITAAQQHDGIAADLLGLVAGRAGVELSLVPTRTWDDSLAAARDGSCQALSFLNKSPSRDEWLTFTEPLLVDPNVLVTREDHEYIANLANEGAVRMVLPSGTAIEERVRRDFPNVAISIVNSEAEAFAWVSEGKADVTLRSMSVAVYTIKKDGWFNLKVAGQIPGYENRLRIGVRSADPAAVALIPALDQAIASITPAERREILNRHVSITIAQPVDWWLVAQIGLGVLMALVILLQRVKMMRIARDQALAHLTQETSQRQEMERFMTMLTRELKRPISVVRLVMGGAKLSDSQRDHVDDALGDMENLLGHCVQVEQLEQGKLEVQPVDCSVREVLQEVITACRGRERVRLALYGDCLLRTDQTLLVGVLNILLSNALKYSPPVSPVDLIARIEKRGHGDVVCFVIENAPGMAGPPDPSLVFQRYYRAPEARKLAGAGLGLYLARHIARLLGGDVAFVPDPVVVRFELWLPCCDGWCVSPA